MCIGDLSRVEHLLQEEDPVQLMQHADESGAVQWRLLQLKMVCVRRGGADLGGCWQLCRYRQVADLVWGGGWAHGLGRKGA